MQNGQLGVCRAYPDLPVSPSAFDFNFVAAILSFAFCHCGPQSAALPLAIQNASWALWVPVGAASSKVIAPILAQADDCLFGGTLP